MMLWLQAEMMAHTAASRPIRSWQRMDSVLVVGPTGASPAGGASGADMVCVCVCVCVSMRVRWRRSTVLACGTGVQRARTAQAGSRRPGGVATQLRSRHDRRPKTEQARARAARVRTARAAAAIVLALLLSPPLVGRHQVAVLPQELLDLQLGALRRAERRGVQQGRMGCVERGRQRAQKGRMECVERRQRAQ